MPPARGDLFLAPFLYSDLEGSKRRPVCVVSSDLYNAGLDVIVAMVTSSTVRREAPGYGDVPLEDWKVAGLLRPSTLRAGRLLVLESRLLQGRLGTITQRDSDATNNALQLVLALP